MNEFESTIQSGEKPRAQRRLPQGSFIQTDQWIPYLGYEQYCWWLTFHSWVDRTPKRYMEQHIPYTLESVFEKLSVSKTTFYRKIKVLWECGLIEIVEFGRSERKSQKPKNIIVYEYPFNNAELEYKPLEKRRDWKKDYDSQSKISGTKGGFMKRLSTSKDHPPKFETVEKSVDNHPPKFETVEKSVDNHENHRTRIETVDRTKFETVTVPELVHNNVFNNLLMSSNNPINVSNNNSLSHTQITLIQDILFAFDFTEGERDKVIELINERQLFNISKDDLIQQAKYMTDKTDIRLRAQFFVNGLEMNIGRKYRKKQLEEKTPDTEKPVFYNWLEN